MAALIKVMSHNEVVYLLFKVCLPGLGRKPRILQFIFTHFAAELQLLPLVYLLPQGEIKFTLSYNRNLSYFIEYSVHFFTWKMMLKYSCALYMESS
jgi:hypothetical protein